MRITGNMTVANFLSSLGKSQERMNHIQEQLSDGKLVHRPSDDPIRALRSLNFSVGSAVNDQYTQNAKDATQWMTQTDSAMSDLSSIMIKVKELVIQAGDVNPDVAYKALGEQVDGLINQAINIANGQVGDRYVFAGQRDKVADGPFVRTTANVGAPPVATEVVVYKGDNNKISMPISPGTADPRRDSVNLTGVDVFGPMTIQADGQATADVFDKLLRIKEELEKPQPNVSWLSSTGLAQVDAAHDQILLAQTQIGTRMANYEMAQNMLEKDNTTIAQNASANNDIDVAQATISFKTDENIYQMALYVGAKIIPPSLADFLH